VGKDKRTSVKLVLQSQTITRGGSLPWLHETSAKQPRMLHTKIPQLYPGRACRPESNVCL